MEKSSGKTNSKQQQKNPYSKQEGAIKKIILLLFFDNSVIKLLYGIRNIAILVFRIVCTVLQG